MKRFIPWALWIFSGIAMAQTCPELTMPQRAVGYLNGINALYVLAMCLGGLGIFAIFGGLIDSFLKNTKFVEFLCWGGSLAAIISGISASTFGSWVSSLGALGLAGAIAYSSHIRKKPKNAKLFAATMMICWGVLAIAFDNIFLGFMSIAALAGVVGFRADYSYFGFSLGWDNSHDLERAITAGGLLVGLYMLATANEVNLGHWYLFKAGALWIGSFMMFLGLLIKSSKYTRGSYEMWSIISIAVFAICIVGGSFLMLNPLVTIASAFLLFFVLEKIGELVVSGIISLGVMLLLAGSGVWYLYEWLLTHPTVLSHMGL
jgi:hypothetical protein